MTRTASSSRSSRSRSANCCGRRLERFERFELFEPIRKEQTMKRFSMVIFLLALLAHSSQSLRAQPTTIRLGHVGFPGPNSIFALMADEYARRVNSDLKGRVEVKVFHSSQLGTDEQRSEER